MVGKPTKSVGKEKRIKKGTFSPSAQAAADKFFAHKKEHPDPVPYEQLTPLQKRMQSGGA